MKQRIKKNIKNIMKTMLEAHNYAMKMLKDGHIVEANGILSQCQDCAVHIGETIEKSEGSDTMAVSYLETYCEQLYQISRLPDKKKIKKLKSELDKSLRYVEYEVDKKIPLDKFKIVFMPYKFSMWDCMESIWEASEKDEECETYVVPIPFYERNQDGSIKRLCYEGDLFPSNIPIISYEEFPVETERPDVIYIHNPYDGANYVTSVHPAYFSSELKKYTDQLVYIPYYFCSNGPMPETHQNLPAYKNIDKIIVQDEEKVESLVDHICKDKIVAIGSPKVDRILKMNKRKQEIIENDIPYEWREIIKEKKVILFNVSISGLLQNTKYAIDKIKYILSKFKNQENIVLMWRPHPLLEATLQSMRPNLYEQYIIIKNSFKKWKNGIFDETGDATIAAIVADAYLGENSSSLVHYFGVLGKPVFYINWKILESRDENRPILTFKNFVREESSLFFVPFNKGQSYSLIQLDLESGIVEKKLEFPGSPGNEWQRYSDLKKLDDKIILIPCNTEPDIYIYDVNRKFSLKIVLSGIYKNAPLFSDAVQYKNKLFLIPISYPAIVSLDVNNFEVREFKECITMFHSKDNDAALFCGAYVKKERFLYLAGCYESKIIIFDMESGNYEIKEIGNYMYGYGHMIFDGNYFWLSAYKEQYIVRWEEKSGGTKKFEYPHREKKIDYEMWSALLDKEDEIIVCDGYLLDMTFINKQTGKCRKEQIIENRLKEMKKKSDEGRGWLFYDFLDAETVILVERKSVNIWNMKTNQWKSYICKLSEEEVLDIERNQIEQYSVVKSVPYHLSENEVSIAQYADYIKKGITEVFKRTYECYSEEGDISIGERVHIFIKNSL